MIHFIDIQTGNIFDGHQPYCFWFDESQSVGLNYIKQICFVSDKSTVMVELNSDVFKLLELNSSMSALKTFEQIPNHCINTFKYKSLEDLIVKNSTYKNYGILHLPKNSSKSVYIHMLYIVGHSDVSGECVETIKIDGEEFLIGADFYNENEILKKNLQNIGFEVPDAIQKAIYEVNLREDSTDTTTLNRKFKELLIEQIDILANKGSYNSLINSLNWFEYGDLIKIQEYWKNKDSVYYRSELTSIIKDSLQDLLQTHTKTTYIGLYLALNKIKVDEFGNVIYAKPENHKHTVNGIDLYSARLNKGLYKENPKQNRKLQINIGNVQIEDFKDGELNNKYGGSNWKRLYQGLIPEPIPQLEYISSLYGKEELSLKMALLGNFYATYFMPIHLDLIHSTIENIVFTDTIKLITFNNYTRNDYINNTQSFNISLDNKGVYYLNNISVSATEYTNMSSPRIFKNDNNEVVEILGVEYLNNIISGGYTNNSGEIVDESAKIWQQLYNGVGCVIPINFDIKLEENTFIQKVNFVKEYIKDGGVKSIYKSFDIIIHPENYDNNIQYNFNILFKEANRYSIGIELILNNGFTYSKRFNDITIVDNTNQDISLYKLQKLTIDEVDKILNNEKPNWNKFAFSTLDQTDNEIYKQYITSNNSYTKNGVGITKVIRQKLYQFENYKNLCEGLGNIIDTTNQDQYIELQKVRKYLLKQFEQEQSSRYYYDIMIREDLTGKDKNDDWAIYVGDGNNKIIIYLIIIDKQFKVDKQEVVLKDYSENPYVVNKNGRVLNTYFKIIQNNDSISLVDLNSTLDNETVVVVNVSFENNTYYFSYNDMNFSINVTPLQLLSYTTNQSEDDYFLYDGLLDNHSYYIYNNGFEIKQIKSYTTKVQELFIPQFHKLVPLEDYKVSEQDVLCVIPQFKYTKQIIDKPYWTFTNNSKNIEIVTKDKTDKNISILGPYISNFKPNQLEKGYYSIKFNYKLQDTIISIEKNNVFLIQ